MRYSKEAIDALKGSGTIEALNDQCLIVLSRFYVVDFSEFLCRVKKIMIVAVSEGIINIGDSVFKNIEDALVALDSNNHYHIDFAINMVSIYSDLNQLFKFLSSTVIEARKTETETAKEW